MFPPIPPDVSLKEYLDSRFDGLEKLIEVRFGAVETTVKCQEDDYRLLKGRVESLENWRAYTLGACLVLAFLAQWLWEKLMS